MRTETTSDVRQNLLIVEDSPDLALRLAEMVDEGGHFKITIAGTLEEARADFFESQPRVILLDLNLPDGSGLDLLREAKEKDRDIAVVVATNHSSDSFRTACKRFGADFFLDKGSELEKLPRLINDLAARLAEF